MVLVRIVFGTFGGRICLNIQKNEQFKQACLTCGLSAVEISHRYRNNDL